MPRKVTSAGLAFSPHIPFHLQHESHDQVREMKVKVLVQQIMKGSENIKENMDHVWRNLEYIEETYEQMFLKTHRIQVWRINLESCAPDFS